MADLILKQWDNFGIRIRDDKYVSLTDMAKATGKRINNWNRLESTKSYLDALSRSAQISVDQLIEINESSGDNITRGTWGHPKVAIRFAQWCNDDFAVQVDSWIDELMSTGSVHLQPQKAPAKILQCNYLPARKECCDQLKRHGAIGKTYGAVEKYNNDLVGIEAGSRHEVTNDQANHLAQNYLFGTIELLKRELGFNNGSQHHLANTAKMSMRHGTYQFAGADSVPEKLKPKKERKQLKAS